MKRLGADDEDELRMSSSTTAKDPDPLGQEDLSRSDVVPVDVVVVSCESDRSELQDRAGVLGPGGAEEPGGCEEIRREPHFGAA